MPLSPIARRARLVSERLAKRYPDPGTELTWSTPWELLVATMLSAQCTDARVNQVTPLLFARWKNEDEMSNADQTDVETAIHSTGFYRNKAKNLREAAKRIVTVFGGEVPRTMEDMLTLPGVARKTANVVLGNAYGVRAGIAVDTHVKRISFRLGLTTETAPDKVEQNLMTLFPRPSWNDVNHYLVLFGREVCVARKPRCPACELADLCPRNGVPSL
jgi:endonuclease-3